MKLWKYASLSKIALLLLLFLNVNLMWNSFGIEHCSCIRIACMELCCTQNVDSFKIYDKKLKRKEKEQANMYAALHLLALNYICHFGNSPPPAPQHTHTYTFGAFCYLLFSDLMCIFWKVYLVQIAVAVVVQILFKDMCRMSQQSFIFQYY